MIPLRFEITEEPPMNVSGRARKESTRKAHKTVTENWQKRMLPDHFNQNKQGKYRFKRRSPKYLASKRRQAAARRPKVRVRDSGKTLLVFSGLMRRLLKRKQVVRAFPTRGTLTIPGPRYVTLRPMSSFFAIRSPRCWRGAQQSYPPPASAARHGKH